MRTSNTLRFPTRRRGTWAVPAVLATALCSRALHAQAAPPPPPSPPAGGAQPRAGAPGTRTEGTNAVPDAGLAATTAAAAARSERELSEKIVTQQVGLNEHDARLKELEKQVTRLTAELDGARARLEAPPPPSRLPDWLEALHDVRVAAYVQTQLEHHQESEDQLRSGGAPLNQNRFLVRRARLQIGREWQYSSLFVELDGNTVRGASFGLHRAEAALMYRDAPSGPALVKLTAGQQPVPFGFEMTASARSRLFMERSQASRAFYPSEPDLGVTLSGEVAWLRYAVALFNGEPLGEQNGFASIDPNHHKDVLLRLGAVTNPSESLTISGGVSVMNGKGFAKGSDATKNTIRWDDSLQNGRVDLTSNELSGVAAAAAVRSYNFDRWMAGADVQVGIKLTGLGWTKLFGELSFASNMDRALYVANPTQGGLESREMGYYVAVAQELSPYASIGFRYDSYDPNADFLGYKSGNLVPAPQTIRTFSPCAAVMLPGRARLAFQYDFIRDHLGRTSAGLPTDLANDAWTLRLQGEL